MKSIVGEWVANLAVIAILAALVDMVLPNGSMRKYTDFLFGLVILAMFLHPFLLMVGQSSDLETVIFQNSTDQLSKSAAYLSSLTEKSQKENLEHYIKTNLEKDLALELEHKTGLDIDNVSIIFGQLNGEVDYSSVQRIDVYTSLKAQQVQIDPVVINSEDESYNSEDAVLKEVTLKIKEIVSVLYDIEPELVFVYMN
ncbi:MAG TPA: stage III sporulation protein AF [Clostridiales bacterium]|nr:stage III sporulation protein AF [Clostridiales bacterium]